MSKFAVAAALVLTGALCWFGATTVAQRGEIRERAEQIEREADRLDEKGHREEAEQLRRKAHEVLKGPEHHHDAHHPRPRHHDEHGHHGEHSHHEDHAHDHDIDHAVEKIGHLQAAAEHLEHAGMGDLARKIRQQAKEMEQAVHRERDRRAHDHAQHGLHDVHQAIRELHAEVRRLHQEIRELHERLDNNRDDDDGVEDSRRADDDDKEVRRPDRDLEGFETPESETDEAKDDAEEE